MVAVAKVLPCPAEAAVFCRNEFASRNRSHSAPSPEKPCPLRSPLPSETLPSTCPQTWICIVSSPLLRPLWLGCALLSAFVAPTRLPAAELFVADRATDRVLAFDEATGEFLRVVTATGLSVPSGLTFGPGDSCMRVICSLVSLAPRRVS